MNAKMKMNGDDFQFIAGAVYGNKEQWNDKLYAALVPVPLSELVKVPPYTWIEAKFEDEHSRILLTIDDIVRKDVHILCVDVENGELPWVEPSQVVRVFTKLKTPTLADLSGQERITSNRVKTAENLIALQKEMEDKKGKKVTLQKVATDLLEVEKVFSKIKTKDKKAKKAVKEEKPKTAKVANGKARSDATRERGPQLLRPVHDAVRYFLAAYDLEVLAGDQFKPHRFGNVLTYHFEYEKGLVKDIKGLQAFLEEALEPFSDEVVVEAPTQVSGGRAYKLRVYLPEGV